MAREAENIGGRIKELRDELGLTQRELADALPGKTEGKDVSRWENGKHRPGPDTLGHIADVLDTTVADLHAGPLVTRKPNGPTPDPFANRTQAASAVDRIEADVQSLLHGQAELAARMLMVERLLEDQRKQQRPAARTRKAKGN